MFTFEKGTYPCTTLLLILILGLSLSYSIPIHSQPGPDLAMRARVNLYEKWDFDSTAYYFDLIIGEENTPAYAYSDFGWWLILEERFEDGLKYIQQAAEMDPPDKQLIAWSAWAQLWSGNLNEAQKWINRALALDPGYGEGLYVSSMIASGKGDHERAVRLAEQASTLDPNWRGALPLALAKAGRKDEALTLAQEFAAEGKMMDTMLLLEVFSLLGKESEALTQLERAYELRHPFMPWIEYVQNIENLRPSSRYAAVLKKMNLPE